MSAPAVGHLQGGVNNIGGGPRWFLLHLLLKSTLLVLTKMHPYWGLSHAKQESRGSSEARFSFRGGTEEWESGSLKLGPQLCHFLGVCWVSQCLCTSVFASINWTQLPSRAHQSLCKV